MLRDEVKGILEDYKFKLQDDLTDEIMRYVNEIFIDCHDDMRSIIYEHFMDYFEDYDNDPEGYIDRYDVADELSEAINKSHQQLRLKDQ